MFTAIHFLAVKSAIHHDKEFKANAPFANASKAVMWQGSAGSMGLCSLGGPDSVQEVVDPSNHQAAGLWGCRASLSVENKANHGAVAHRQGTG